MPGNIRLRLTGDETNVGAIVDALRGMPDVDSVVDLGADPVMRNGGSRHARRRGGVRADTRTVETRLTSSLGWDYVHDRIGTLAASVGVTIEWLDG